MSGAPAISVVIIFLNAEPFLEEAVASVFAQTTRDWELLLVDDGSSDASTDVARRLAGEHPETVRYLEHDGHANRGMSASRNRGLRSARGRFVLFLDADDALRPEALAEQRALLEAHPETAMVYGPLLLWHGWTGAPQDRRRDHVQSLGVPVDAVMRPPELLVRFLRRDAAAPSGMLVRRDAAERVGGFDDAFRGMYEDQAFCTKICLASPVYVASSCWYKYRQHQRSSSAAADRSGEYDYGRLPFLTWLEGYLAAQGVTRGPVWRAAQRELWLARHPAVHRQLKGARRARRRWAQRWNRLVQRAAGAAAAVRPV